jgi:hypothetical protein
MSELSSPTPWRKRGVYGPVHFRHCCGDKIAAFDLSYTGELQDAGKFPEACKIQGLNYSKKARSPVSFVFDDAATSGQESVTGRGAAFRTKRSLNLLFSKPSSKVVSFCAIVFPGEGVRDA